MQGPRREDLEMLGEAGTAAALHEAGVCMLTVDEQDPVSEAADNAQSSQGQIGSKASCLGIRKAVTGLGTVERFE